MANAMRCTRMMKLMRMRVGNEVGHNTLLAYNTKGYGDLDKLLREKMPLKTDIPSQDGIPKNSDTVYLSEESRSALINIRDLMRDAILMRKAELPEMILDKLREEYLTLDWENRQRALLVLSVQFGVDRKRVLSLINHYTSLNSEADEDSDGAESARYRTERDLRLSLIPVSARLFEQTNEQAGGLKFLVDLRADLLKTLKDKNLASLRELDTELKGLFTTWLGPACLELKRMSWDDSAALLEKIVVYEAVHPISNLYDLKRRLGVGRRCYGYFHPAMAGEPLVFIEVALSKYVIGSIQNVLSEEPPIAEVDATTAVFYSISSTQEGLAGIELGNFLIKRVVTLLQHEMPNIKTFITLSPIPGFTNWLLPKLNYQVKYSTSDTKENTDKLNGATPTFKENVLLPEEERNVLNVNREDKMSANAVEILSDLLKSPDHEWAKSEKWVEVLRPILMRLCARYLLVEKKRGRALDPVTNFHIRNGAMVERLNWMGDTSPNGLKASAGIMVNYLYSLEDIETNNKAYLSKGVVAASPAIEEYLQSRL